MPVVTSRPITLSYFVSDLTTALVTFDRMQWFRSRTGPDGPFSPLTASAAGPATLLGMTREPHALAGRTLKLMVNGVTEIEVIFGGSDPYSTAQVISDVAAETGIVTATDVDGALRLTTVATGTNASLEILECDAAPFLGFIVGSASVGVSLNITLASGTEEYFITDQNSDESFWYRTQLRHSTTGQVSGFSVPIPAAAVPVLPASKLIIAFVKLVDMQGRPIEGRKIILANTFMPNMVDDFGIFRHSVSLVTDSKGYGEIHLLRGMELDVHFEGTSYTRRVRLPSLTSPITSINLLDPSLSISDEFGIAEPNIDFAIRMS